jgi:transcriptional regulator with PAS, ATPase and Fis domain
MTARISLALLPDEESPADAPDDPDDPIARDLVLASPAMRRLYTLARQAAAGNSNVLITGETGTGKEVLAEVIHQASPRAGKPFLAINCAALGESLAEAELFGYERGAFTGAVTSKPGLLEAAGGGTLFLDEIGEMSLAVQAKLLRAIESRQVLRLGALKPRPVGARIVAATNRELEAEVAAGRFRQDLFFRLDVIGLAIPPLRERPEDIAPLARLFAARHAPAPGRPPALSTSALALLRAYAWPGNVRELRNVIERATAFCAGDAITPEHLPLEKLRFRAPPPAPADDGARLRPLPRLKSLERAAMVEALAQAHGNQTRAALRLGMPRRTFCKRMIEYGIGGPRGPERLGSAPADDAGAEDDAALGRDDAPIRGAQPAAHRGPARAEEHLPI